MSPEEPQRAAQHSNSVLQKLGRDIQWVHSYVAGDKIYCIYTAPSEDLSRKHAEQSGFPANKITRGSPPLSIRRRQNPESSVRF